jgi:MarR family transcriptional regulator, negative regulator of the multidrug operon emrRAB
VSEARDPRLANLVGALSLGLADRQRDATERAAGHSAAAPAALVALYEFLGGGSMDQLRRAVGLTPSGAVRLVDRLVAEGDVQRRPGHDGRSVSLVLTAKGRRAARRVLAARSEAMDGVLDHLTDEERASLGPIVERMLGVVTLARLADREGGREPVDGWLCRLCDFEACQRDRGACPVAGAASSRAHQ